MTDLIVIEPRPVRGGWSVRGYKGKGGGEARTPVESPDNLHSTSYARVLDLISEGEIVGLVNGLQSIYLDGTPLRNDSGAFNFEGVTVDVRHGTQQQDPIPGYPASENSYAVGTELKAGTPWVRSFSNRNLSAVRVTLGVNGLSKADTSNGDIKGHKVSYAIDLQTNGGVWQEVLSSSFSGKTTSQYRRTHRIDLPAGASSWSVRVRRLTPNANSGTTADTTVIDSVTEVIDGKLRYPMSALVGIQVDASQFRSIPTRAYHMRGRIIRVPSNYTPATRTYTGVWDGTFKTAYTNNPAWVFYDLVTNDRYGLGRRIPAQWLNKWALYQIGAYCDELVPDGRGGMEPRFTCNVYLQSQGDAYRVLQDLCSIFRGIVYWAAGAAVPAADMPRDPVYTYSQTNVIGGRFVYTGTPLKTRATVALVSYNDMTDMGRQKVVYVQDDEAVARYGIRKTEIAAFGCTSEAQAYRVGQWALLTARRETRSVSFSVGLDGTLCAPGQVIRVADSMFAGRRISGRIHAATASQVTLDSVAEVAAGDTLVVNLPSGVSQARQVGGVQEVGGKLRVDLAQPFDAAPVPESVWAVESQDLAAQLFTVVSVAEGEGLTFDITAVQHDPGKFAAIDHGTRLDDRPISVVPPRVQTAPQAVAVSSYEVLTQGISRTTVVISWDAPEGAVAYDVEWQRSDSEWVKAPRQRTTQLEISNAYSGTYVARARAVNAIEGSSLWTQSQPTQVDGLMAAPPAVVGFKAVSRVFGISLSWGFPSGLYVADKTELLYSLTNDFDDAIKLSDVSYPQGTHELMGLAAGQEFYFWARIVDKNGLAGPWSAPLHGAASSDAAPILDYISGKIDKSVLAEELRTPIEQVEQADLSRIDLIDRIDFDRIDLLNEVPVPELQKLASVDLSRIEVIDRIDKAGGPLGKSLLEAAASLESTQQQVRQGMNEMAQGLLEAALAADAALERITDAGVYVDPTNGQVKIYGLEATKEEVTNLEIMLDAVVGQLALKATTAYVDGKIAEAVLSPADLLLYEGLDARLVQVAQTLDSINGTLTQKANALELQDAVVRLTTAENTLDALGGQIALRVTRAEYEGDQNALNSRLSSAELTLNALDVPSIQATVQAASSVIKDAEKQAQALLQDILTGERNREQAEEALAFARSELSAAITDGLQAEAQQRTQLAVQFGQSLAAVQQSLSTLSAADVAEAQARMALSAQLQQGLQALNAAMETEQRVRADADAAEVLARESLKAQLEGVDDALLAAIEEEESARVTADQAEAAARQQLAARLDGKDGELQAAIVAEQAARASGDAAEATQRQLLAATVAANRTEGLDAVDAAFAAIASEQSARASADAALAQRVDQVQAGVAGNAAAIAAEQTARASGDAAEALARQNLQATVEANRTESMNAVETAFGAIASEQSVRAAADEALGQRIDVVQASVVDYTAAIHGEQQARADAISAEARRTDALLAVSQKQAVTDAERTAEALLQDIVNTEQAKERMRQDVAMVRSEAAARLEEGLLAEAHQRQQLMARLDGQAAALESESLTRATADQAEALQREQLAASVQQGQTQLAAQIQQESQARADADAAEAHARQQLAAQLGQGLDAVQAAVQTEQQARVSDVASLAGQITTVQAAAGDADAKAETALQAISTTDGKLAATMSFRVQLNANGAYHFAGFGLGVENSGGVLQSQFLVTADRFAILPAATSAAAQAASPFAVENGQVIIRDAVIGNASITSAKIADWLESDAVNSLGQKVWRLNMRTGEMQFNGSTGGNGRLTINNNLVQVYHPNGVLATRMGIW